MNIVRTDRIRDRIIGKTRWRELKEEFEEKIEQMNLISNEKER